MTKKNSPVAACFGCLAAGARLSSDDAAAAAIGAADAVDVDAGTAAVAVAATGLAICGAEINVIRD